MEPLYDLNAADSLKPQFYKIGSTFSLSLFPVPHDNAVGTNDMHNAITIISFPRGKKPRFDRHFRRAVSDVRGGGTYLPITSDDSIGFGQTRRFLLYNFKTKTHEEYRIVFSLDCTIEKISIADSEKRRFIFQIQEHTSGSPDPWDYTNLLQLIDLSGKEVKLIKEINYGKGVTWTAAFNKIFLYCLEKEEVQVLDMNFEPSHHPLADISNRNKSELSFTWILPHPYLPFAILSGGKTGSTLIGWGENRNQNPIPLIKNGVQFSFSPDGKWVAFKKDYPEPQSTYLMPVSEKYPNFLGSPILLINDYFNKFAWTTNPVSFVGSDGDLYRWELTNEAYPQSDKATFWDYIVESDLENLTREKRQGLGQNE
ncbi:MAG: hypothetical protein KFF50_10030 [Desulfatitalea sp.]|nr:hypothetical protein [Desulfatitalea sp.]